MAFRWPTRLVSPLNQTNINPNLNLCNSKPILITMKLKLIAVLSALAIASTLQFAFAAGGPVTPPVVDIPDNPINIARAFALNPFTNCQWQIGGEMLIDNQYIQTHMTLTTRKNGAITSILINDDPIPLPNGPIYGLPMGNGGVFRNVNIYVSAMNDTGDCVANGQLNQALVKKGDSLVVPLIPGGLRQEIVCDLPSSGNVDLIIEGFDDGYSWGVQDGHLYVYLPPVGGIYNYTVRNMTTGAIIGSGTIEPFKPTVAANRAYVGVSYAGNVIEAEFPQPDGYDAWANLRSVEFDCSIPWNGSTAPGKVIFADCGGGGLEVQSFMTHCQVYVQQVTTEGDMPYLALTDNSAPGTTRVSTIQKNIGKVVITIINLGPYDRTWLQLHRDYGNGGGTVGVGSVGAPTTEDSNGS